MCVSGSVLDPYLLAVLLVLAEKLLVQPVLGPLSYLRPTFCLLNLMETHQAAPHQRGETVKRRHAQTRGSWETVQAMEQQICLSLRFHVEMIRRLKNTSQRACDESVKPFSAVESENTALRLVKLCVSNTPVPGFVQRT